MFHKFIDIEEIPSIKEDIVKRDKKIKNLEKQYKLILDILETK